MEEVSLLHTLQVPIHNEIMGTKITPVKKITPPVDPEPDESFTGTLKRYAINLLLWIDEGGNAITGGSPNETISERSAKAMDAGKTWGCVLCKFLDWLQKDHCEIALTSTIGDNAIIPDGE